MNSVTTSNFRARFGDLPIQIQQLARKAYGIWKSNPNHPSLQFKLIDPNQSIYSVRVNLGYRALGIKDGDTIIWFWIGSHAEYDKLIATL